MLGDYVYRGLDSAGVIRLLRKIEGEGRLLCLKGNHEAIMVKASRYGRHRALVLSGGKATLRSYRGL